VTDVVVAPHDGGWTVRHPRRLHERFERRADALRKAHGYVRQLTRDGERCALKEARSFAPTRLPRDRA
jgi:hypothetical protein